MSNVIITGGTGFIGGWLTEELLKNNVSVTLLVRDPNKVVPSLKNNVTIIPYNFNNIMQLSIPKKEYTTFYHLAWEGVAPEKKDDIALQLENIDISIKTMQFAKMIGCKKFIAAGTVAEYVFCEDILDVNEKQTPNDMYGAVKVAIHYMLDVLSKQIELPFIWVVLPSTFGERRTDNNIITYTIKSLLNRERPIYGNLEQMWDFLYVSDVARALRLIGEKGIAGKTYGIGSGIYKHLYDYIIKIRDIIDPSLPLGIGEVVSYNTKTFSSCVNTYDLIKDTGFSPEVDFETGIRKTILYFKDSEK